MPDHILPYLNNCFLLAVYQVHNLLAKMYLFFTTGDPQVHFLWLLSVG